MNCRCDSNVKFWGFSRRYKLILSFSWLWYRIVWYMSTSISEEHNISTFRRWIGTPCSLVHGYKSFGGIFCLHRQMPAYDTKQHSRWVPMFRKKSSAFYNKPPWDCTALGISQRIEHFITTGGRTSNSTFRKNLLASSSEWGGNMLFRNISKHPKAVWVQSIIPVGCIFLENVRNFPRRNPTSENSFLMREFENKYLDMRLWIYLANFLFFSK
jgi:hypothetical protein